MQDVEDITDKAGSGGGFIELGKVYQDPMTGKYYMLQEDMDRSVSEEDGGPAAGGQDSGEVEGNDDE
jgi:hypothetical protein